MSGEIYLHCTEMGPLREDGTRWASGEVLTREEAISRGLLKEDE